MSQATLMHSEPDHGSKLPRGPHALPQEVVVAHQRERLLEAAADAMAEQGYAELTVRELVSRAGVSRRTFYQLYDDKLDCVFAAHEAAFERLSKVIVDACSSQAAWPDKVVAAVDGALDLASQFPNQAHLIVVSSHTATEPKLANRGRAAHEQLAAVLSGGRQQGENGRKPLDLTEQAVVGAVMSIVGNRLLAGEADRLPGLKAELVQIILTPYFGDVEARRVATAAG